MCFLRVVNRAKSFTFTLLVVNNKYLLAIKSTPFNLKSNIISYQIFYQNLLNMT